MHLIADEHPLFTAAERPLDSMYQRNISFPVRRGQEPSVLANGDTVLNNNSDMKNFGPDSGYQRVDALYLMTLETELAVGLRCALNSI